MEVMPILGLSPSTVEFHLGRGLQVSASVSIQTTFCIQDRILLGYYFILASISASAANLSALRPVPPVPPVGLQVANEPSG